MTRWFVKKVFAVVAIGIIAISVSCAPYKSVEFGPRAKVTLSKATVSSDFDAIVFVPNASCSFDSVGRNWLKRDADSNELTFYIPPGRSYFRVWLSEPGFGKLSSQDISFIAEDGQEYLIEYVLGDIETKTNNAPLDPLGIGPYSKKERTLRFNINYFQIDGNKRKTLEIDHWDICDRN